MKREIKVFHTQIPIDSLLRPKKTLKKKIKKNTNTNRN